MDVLPHPVERLPRVLLVVEPPGLVDLGIQGGDVRAGQRTEDDEQDGQDREELGEREPVLGGQATAASPPGSKPILQPKGHQSHIGIRGSGPGYSDE